MRFQLRRNQEQKQPILETWDSAEVGVCSERKFLLEKPTPARRGTGPSSGFQGWLWRPSRLRRQGDKARSQPWRISGQKNSEQKWGQDEGLGAKLLIRIGLCCAQSRPTLQAHKLQSPGFLCSWDSPGKNTGVGCHFLLQGIFPTQESNPCLLHSLHWQGDSLALTPPGQPWSQSRSAGAWVSGELQDQLCQSSWAHTSFSSFGYPLIFASSSLPHPSQLPHGQPFRTVKTQSDRLRVLSDYRCMEYSFSLNGCDWVLKLIPG